MPIAAHHTQIMDGGSIGPKAVEFLKDHPNTMALMNTFAQGLPPLPSIASEPDLWRREVRLRMAFSSLVDADYLDTEKHFVTPHRPARPLYPPVTDLCDAFERKQCEWMASKSSSPINQIRRKIYDSCLARAEGPRGFYRLTVPTGGGKTLSGLAFALRHAKARGMHRVIVAVPYTSIIEQTVDVYRGIFGKEAVLEHHSQVTLPENEREDEGTMRQLMQE